MKRSTFTTSDMDAASLVYVHSHCYHTWWLAHSIITEQDQTVIQSWIDQAHEAVTQLPRWKRSDGKDFVFFEVWLLIDIAMKRQALHMSS